MHNYNLKQEVNQMNKMKKLAAALACVMTMTVIAPYSAYAMDVSGTESTMITAKGISSDKLDENTDKTISGITELVKSDDKLKGLIKSAEGAAALIAENFPEVKFVTVPFIQMMKAFYTGDEPEVTLDSLAKKMRSISCDMKDMKKDLIEAMASANDMAEFVKAYNNFERVCREIHIQFDQISCWNNLPQEEKDIKMANLIGTREKWVNDDNAVSALSILGYYLTGEKKLSSGNNTIYTTMVNHYSKSVCFGKEAIEKTDSFIGDAAAIYLQGSIEMIDCLLAERAQLLRQGTKSAECDADYCVDKIKSILQQVEDVKTCINKYRKNTNPLMFYDHSGNTQKNIPMLETLGRTDFTAAKELKNILPGERILSTEQMQYIINYVKTYHPEKTLREFLQYVGFKFTGNDYEKAFMMVNMGGPKSMQMSSGCARNYYYKGVDLKDKNYNESENLYLYVSIGWTTVSRNEAQYPMYYMICS